jgi:hypothetical protein
VINALGVLEDICHYFVSHSIFAAATQLTITNYPSSPPFIMADSYDNDSQASPGPHDGKKAKKRMHMQKRREDSKSGLIHKIASSKFLVVLPRGGSEFTMQATSDNGPASGTIRAYLDYIDNPSDPRSAMKYDVLELHKGAISSGHTIQCLTDGDHSELVPLWHSASTDTYVFEHVNIVVGIFMAAKLFMALKKFAPPTIVFDKTTPTVVFVRMDTLLECFTNYPDHLQNFIGDNFDCLLMASDSMGVQFKALHDWLAILSINKGTKVYPPIAQTVFFNDFSNTAKVLTPTRMLPSITLTLPPVQQVECDGGRFNWENLTWHQFYNHLHGKIRSAVPRLPELHPQGVVIKRKGVALSHQILFLYMNEGQLKGQPETCSKPVDWLGIQAPATSYRVEPYDRRCRTSFHTVFGVQKTGNFQKVYMFEKTINDDGTFQKQTFVHAKSDLATKSNAHNFFRVRMMAFPRNLKEGMQLQGLNLPLFMLYTANIVETPLTPDGLASTSIQPTFSQDLLLTDGNGPQLDVAEFLSQFLMDYMTKHWNSWPVLV